MARSGFSLRFGYGLWLRHLTEGEPPSFADIGRSVGAATGAAKALVGQTVSGWAKRDEATDSRKNNRALADYFGASEAWLVDGEGEPPHTELWAVWLAERKKPQRPIQSLGAESLKTVAKSTAGKKRVAK